MGKITIDEMHNSLFDYAQAVSDENLMTENKTIVGAINEIYGKRLIADSIGEPLNNTDTFTKMSDDINNLLSTFKTNIMNAGIAVESGDKFKTLIDKIKGLTEGEGNKGIQFAQGNGKQISVNTLMDEGISVDIDFEPMYLFLAISNRNTPSYTTSGYHGGIGTLGVIAICMPDLVETDSSRTIGLGAVGNGNSSSFYYDIVFNTGLTDGKITIEKKRVGASWIYGDPAIDYDWLAIRTGEEDTTLRDLLASILQDKGVEVTEEDTMVDLINKVATLDDDEGIQFAEGVINTISDSTKTFTATKIIGGSAGTEDLYYNTIELDFEPYILFTETIVESYYLGSLKDTFVINNFYNSFSDELTISHIAQYQESLYKAYYNLEREGNVYYNPIINALTAGVNDYVVKETKYYAIGLGEKDNTICDEGKGLQYAEGTLTAFLQNYNTGDSITFNIDCDFVPTALFLKVASVSGSSDSQIQNIFVSNLNPFTINPDPRIFNGNSPTYLIEAEITNLTNNSFDIHIINGGACKSVIQFTNYYAIGVGGNTTLRDSLASILQNKGVEVTEEDDLASLISKVDTLENSENKGTQYAEGTYEDFTEYLTTSGSSIEVPCELNFTPTLIFVKFNSINNAVGTTISNAVVSSKDVSQLYMDYNLSCYIDNISSNSFSMIFSYGNNSNITFKGVTWYAIG